MGPRSRQIIINNAGPALYEGRLPLGMINPADSSPSFLISQHYVYARPLDKRMSK